MFADRSVRPFPLYVVCALLTAGLLIYSQTNAFAWDEGFHLVAAQLIVAGKKPYVDWMFPQVPLNAYWNALWMRVFGEGWRITHVIAALATSGATLLTGTFVLARFPVPRWRMPLAILCAILVGTNVAVVEFGAIAQAYGICLFSIVAAFWFAAIAVDRPGIARSFAAGLMAGIAAGSSLLTAPVGPALLVWMLLCNRAGSRWSKLAGVVAGEATAFLPVAWLFALAPRQTWFAIVQYHLYYRQVAWSGAVRHDLETMAGVIDFPQALLLCLLALGGLLFVYFRSGWERARKQEFYLCVLVAISLALHLSTAHPTFARYYLFTVPFLSYPAAAGLYLAGSSIWSAERPWLPVGVLCTIVTLGAAKDLYDTRADMRWKDLEPVAAKVKEVARADHALLADEAIYFLLHRLPPPGNEVRDSHKLDFPPDRAGMLHVLPEAVLDRRIQAGRYPVVERCNDDDWLESVHLKDLFANSAEVGDCTVFWDWKGSPAK